MQDKDNKEKNYLITGANFSNKGAQAMLFITINEIKKINENNKIYMHCAVDSNKAENNNYNIIFEENLRVLKLYSCGGFYRLYSVIKNIEKKYTYEKLISFDKLLNKIDIIIDISGYALSSIWGNRITFNYLYLIIAAKHHNIPVYLMPQSFGPFNYTGFYGIIINYLIKKYMPYPKIIYARENEGFNSLINKYNLKNVRKSFDLVLQNKHYELKNIYKKLPSLKPILIEKNKDNIAIIPNMRNFEHGNKNEIINLYKEIINQLLSNKKIIYLIRHSKEDIEACKSIKKLFEENNNVILMEDEFNCFDFENLLNKFDFLIASRYHSIVQAYKNKIPCLVLGWAEKYHELLKTFNQDKYIFDVRENIDKNAIKYSLNELINNFNIESKIIGEILKKVQMENCFDILR